MKNNDPKYMQRFASNIITSPYPNLLKQIGNYFTSDKKDPQSFYDYIKNSMGYPFNRKVQSKLDVFGETDTTKTSILGRIFGQQITKKQETEMSSILDKLSADNVTLSIPTKTTKIKPEDADNSRKMTDKELKQYQEIYGKNLKDNLLENKDWILELTGDELDSEIKTIKSDTEDQSKQDLLDKLGF